MNLVRHFVVLGIVVLAFVVLGHWLPKQLQISPSRLVFFQDPPSTVVDTTKPAPTLREQLFETLQVKKETKRRSPKHNLWTLGKGKDLPVYLLDAQKVIHSEKGQIVRMEELNNKQKSARFTWTDSLGDTSAIELTIGEDFLTGSSSIAILFAVDSTISIPVLNMLNSLAVPYALLVQPFDTNQALRYDLDRLANKEVVIWIGMEPHQYPWVNPGPNSILIHHNQKQIANIMEEAHKSLPMAIGLASRMGERAMEHRPLLEALLRAAAKESLWFMDLAKSRFSKSTEVCAELGLSCLRSQVLDQDKDPEEYWQKSLQSASKSGASVVILHLSEENVAATRNALPIAEAQGTEIVKLSKFMSLPQ